MEPPRVTVQVPAEYPASELLAKHEATVVLLVTIGRDGSVTTVDVAESAGQAFDDAAIAAAKRWQFTPALRDGQPVASRIRVPFRFELPLEQREEPSVPAPVPAPPAVAPPASEPRGARAPSPPVSAEPATVRTEEPAEVVVLGQRELRTERRSVGDFQVKRDVLRAAPRQEGAEVLRTAPGLYIGRGEGPHALRPAIPWAPVLAALGFGFALPEGAHHAGLGLAVVLSLGLATTRAYRARLWRPLAVANCGAAVLVIGHAFEIGAAEIVGAIGILLSGLLERRGGVPRSATSAVISCRHGCPSVGW